MAAPSNNTLESYTNPEVRYERSDIESDNVTYYSIAFVLLLLTCFGLALAAYPFFLGIWEPSKAEALPETVSPKLAEVEPRLEAIEDLEGAREGGRPRYKWLPPRAAEYYEPQMELLSKGKDGRTPIDKAINDLAGKLPANTKGKTPVTYGATLPSDGAAGRALTGGR
ncbi:MAG: hypothetical protein SNJ75_09685 [Gemmataceae bacterium]